MTSGISHFAIKVRDLVRAEQFYCGLLGLEIERRWPDPAGTGTRSLWLRTGDPAGTFLALEIAGGAAGSGRAPDQRQPEPQQEREREQKQERPRGAHDPGHHLLALRIRREQRQTYEARLAEAGVTVSHRTRFTIYFSDPEGNRLGLSHHPEALDPPGPA